MLKIWCRSGVKNEAPRSFLLSNKSNKSLSDRSIKSYKAWACETVKFCECCSKKAWIIKSFSSRPRRQRQRNLLNSRIPKGAFGSKSCKKLSITFMSKGRTVYWELLNGPTNHQLFDLANGLCGVQALGAHVHTVHDGVTAKESIGIFEVVQALASGLIAAVGNETVGLQETSGADEFVRVPPKRGAARGAARARSCAARCRRGPSCASGQR